MDIIHVLPDSITDQIAAGEVIQRPASVVKELLENAIDAKADIIQIVIKESGCSLIQVKDNGIGMSANDARLSFERHATSKISIANDLSTLRTFGFRGEALAAIAAVSQVELKTRMKNRETGTLIQISASRIEKEEIVVTGVGSIFSVKNLFYNLPVRKRFLKSNETEFRNILIELERVALVNPQVDFSLFHNDEEIMLLPVSTLKQRIIQSTGKKIIQHFLPIDINISNIHIYGFIGSPNSCKKRGALQYFFVNGRYMRHAYFHRAVFMAFEPFLPYMEQPNYFLYIEIDPSSIDVNIHPTKTEIKFENEPMIFQILLSIVKDALAVPMLEFDQKEIVDIPIYKKSINKLTISDNFYENSYFNPFKNVKNVHDSFYTNLKDFNFVNLLQERDVENLLFDPVQINYLQYQKKYLILFLRGGLTIVDQHRAHVRILFDDYLMRINQQKIVSQKLIFPEKIFFSPKEVTVLTSILDDLAFIGFDLVNLGNRTYSINGIPPGLDKLKTIETIHEIINKIILVNCEIKKEITEALVLASAYKMAVPYEKALSKEESLLIIKKLFSSSYPYYTPDGKKIIYIFSKEDINQQFS